MQGIFEDLTGQKFNRLHVLERSSEKRGNHIVWKCLCDCGNLHYVIGFHLKSGTIGSCGCLQKDSVTTHGMKGKPEYRAWDGIINRCTNPNDPRYKDYGARGIAVNEKWKDFKEFFVLLGRSTLFKLLHQIRALSFGNVRRYTFTRLFLTAKNT